MAQLDAAIKLNKLDATAAPAVGDDSADGYSVGSVWIDVTNDQFYMCLDASAGAAVWHNVTGTLRASDGSPVALTVGATGAVTAAIAPFTLTGGQLAFPAAQNASADANTLDDYEEGTWTPALWGNITPGSQTYNPAPTGWYTKVGRVVTATFNILLSAKGTLDGTVYITGFPFACADPGAGITFKYWGGLAANQVLVTAGMGTTATSAILYTLSAAGAGVALSDDASIGNTSQFIGTAVYQT
jgi:hypothetical protein